MTTEEKLATELKKQNAELLAALKEVEKICLDAEEKENSNGWLRDILDIVGIKLSDYEIKKNSKNFFSR